MRHLPDHSPFAIVLMHFSFRFSSKHKFLLISHPRSFQCNCTRNSIASTAQHIMWNTFAVFTKWIVQRQCRKIFNDCCDGCRHRHHHHHQYQLVLFKFRIIAVRQVTRKKNWCKFNWNLHKIVLLEFSLVYLMRECSLCSLLSFCFSGPFKKNAPHSLIETKPKTEVINEINS